MTAASNGQLASRRRWLFLLIFGLCGLTYFYNLGASRIWNLDEALYAVTAREMVATGDWMTPRFNSEHFFDKPVLVYWLMSLSYRVFGVNEFAARFPNAVYSLIGLLVLFGIGKSLLGVDTALIGTLVLGTALEHHSGATYAESHTGLTFYVALSLLFFLRGYQGGTRKRWWFLLFYLSMALGALTKGPVALILPSLIVAVFLALRRDWGAWKRIELGWGIPLFLVVVLPWNLLMLHLYGGEFVRDAWAYEDLSRYARGLGGGREFHQLFYYFYNFPGEFFPWGLFMIPALVRFRARLRQATAEERTTLTFLLTWFITAFVFFSLSAGQIAYYISLVNTAAALLIADFFVGLRLAAGETLTVIRRLTDGFLVFSVAVILLVTGALVILVFPDVSWGERGFFLAVWIVGLGLIVHFTRQDGVARGVGLLGATTICFHLFASGCIMPRIERYRPYPQIAERIRHEGGAESTVVLYRLAKPSFLFYLQRKAIVINSALTNVEYMRRRELASHRLLTEDDDLKELAQVLRGPQRVFCLMDSADYAKVKNLFPEQARVLERYTYIISSESRIGTFLQRLGPSRPKDTLLLVGKT